jgi:hypothetical protein
MEDQALGITKYKLKKKKKSGGRCYAKLRSASERHKAKLFDAQGQLRSLALNALT